MSLSNSDRLELQRTITDKLLLTAHSLATNYSEEFFRNFHKSQNGYDITELIEALSTSLEVELVFENQLLEEDDPKSASLGIELVAEDEY